jgi:hypothetical protein
MCTAFIGWLGGYTGHKTGLSFCMAEGKRGVPITSVFKKNANIFAKNGRKSQKIVIITSTPGVVHACSLSSSISSTQYLGVI